MSQATLNASRLLAGSANAPWDMEGVRCDACGAEDAVQIMQARDLRYNLPGSFTVVRCRRCGLAYQNPRPAPDDLMRAYPTDYRCHQDADVMSAAPSVSSERAGLVARVGDGIKVALANRYYGGVSGADPLLEGAGLYARAAGHVMLPNLPTGGGLSLDVGCGAGWLVNRFSRAGWQAYGIEPGAEAAERARRLTKRPIYAGTLPGVELPPASFDAITFWHVLEHVPSPLATLRAAAALLRPGGSLLVVVPNFGSIERRLAGERWFGLDLPRHLYQFEPKTLQRLLIAAGLRPHRLVVHNEGWMFALNIGRRHPSLAERPAFKTVCGLAAAALSLCGDGSVLAAYCSK